MVKGKGIHQMFQLLVVLLSENYLNNVLKAEKFKFDVVQDAQEDIEANANPTGAVQRVNAQFNAIYKKYKECHKRKKKIQL